MSKCILVIGTPRSGTSLCAGVLHALGVSMGQRFQEPSEMNPRGFWVDLDFDEPLHNINMDNWPPKVTAEHAQVYRELIRQRCDNKSLWGVKQLWTGLTWPLFSEQADVRVVRTVREAAVSKKSLASWTGHAPQAISMIIEHCRKLADEVSGVPILDVEYDRLIDEPEATVRAIAEFVGVPLVATAVGLIDPSLRRAC
jgi:hypothetical protein